MAERGGGQDGAQMMLLGAVVLVIGFLVLSGITARITQLPQETARQAGALLDEAAALERSILLLKGGGGGSLTALQMEHLALLGRSHGFVLSYDCLADELTLADGLGSVRVGILNLCA